MGKTYREVIEEFGVDCSYTCECQVPFNKASGVVHSEMGKGVHIEEEDRTWWICGNCDRFHRVKGKLWEKVPSIKYGEVIEG